MAEDQAQLPATTDAPKAVRVYTPVESKNPVMSTAGFEHSMRLATVIAQTGMMHKTLTHGKIDGNEVELPMNTQAARAFMIVELAARLDESPMSVMQCASFVHGKLMLEGKFIDAILETKFGIKTTKEFGAWDAKTEKTIRGEEGQGDNLGIIVSGMVNGRMEEVHGSVGIWKTTGNGSPWKPGSMHKMLGNRGVREFSRVHQAGASIGIIGVIGDDEVDDLPAFDHDTAPARRPRAQKADLGAKLGKAEGEGFNHEAVKGVLDQHDPKTGEVLEKERPTETGSAQTAEPKPATAASATAASTGSAAATSGQQAHEPKSEGGEKASPEKAAIERETQSGGAAVDAERQEEDEDDLPDALKAQPNRAEEVNTAARAKDEGEDDLIKSPAFTAFWSATAGKLWPEVKKALPALYNSDDFKALDPDDQNAMRARIWAARGGEGVVDHAGDVTAFRLWMTTQEGSDGADAIEGTYRVLKLEPAFQNMKPEQQATMDNVVKHTCATLRAA